MLNIDEVLKEMKDTFTERNERYSENWRAMGKVMELLFPDGLHLHTADDFIRFGLFEWALGKLIRFARTGLDHEDSLIDAAVYTAILLSYAREFKKGQK